MTTAFEFHCQRADIHPLFIHCVETLYHDKSGREQKVYFRNKQEKT